MQIVASLYEKQLISPEVFGNPDKIAEAVKAIVPHID